DITRAALGPGASWGEALRTWLEELRAALAAGAGAVAVTTALRRGHRLGLAKAAADAGVPAHLLMLDAGAELCRAGRAAQGEARIPDGLFEHLLREWQAFRTALETAPEPSPFDSIAVLDRAAADRLRRITVEPVQGRRR
ncbi:MAG TPA: AAA family ATPase, partial [Myxococcales bacterium]|nr:AAA family ATPase [Myxococcales bacterium]